MLSTLLVGIVYGGIMAYDRAVVANAVAVGARTLAHEEGDPTACTDATNAIIASAYAMNTSELTITTPPEFTAKAGSGAGSSSCDVTTGTNPYTGASCTSSSPCQILKEGELVTMAASYPCSMYFPRLGINLCSMAQGTTTITNGGGTINVTCPYPYCVYSIETALIE